MKRFQVLLLVCAFVFGMACLHATPAESATIIKIAGMKPEGEPETIAMHSFGKHLERLSNGKYKVQVFPNSMLGKEDAYIANTSPIPARASSRCVPQAPRPLPCSLPWACSKRPCSLTAMSTPIAP